MYKVIVKRFFSYRVFSSFIITISGLTVLSLIRSMNFEAISSFSFIFNMFNLDFVFSISIHARCKKKIYLKSIIKPLINAYYYIKNKPEMFFYSFNLVWLERLLK